MPNLFSYRLGKISDAEICILSSEINCVRVIFIFDILSFHDYVCKMKDEQPTIRRRSLLGDALNKGLMKWERERLLIQSRVFCV